MKRFFFPRAFGLALCIGVCLLSGCSKSDQKATAAKAALPFEGQTLNVFNWSDYIDPELVPEFEKRTGARVQYDTYSSDAELETKLLAGGAGYDVIFPSDRSMPMLIKKEFLLPIDRSLVPNWKHLDEKFLTPPYDSTSEYEVPYFWGTVAVGIRTDHVSDEPKDFNVLFDERFKGHITMLDDPENVVAVALLALGLPMNSTKDEDLARAKELLVKQKPLVQAYTSDSYKERLIKGEAWVALGWSGDILQAKAENDQIAVILPDSGSMIWVDSMAIPKGAKNARLAHEFANYMLDPQIAARNANFVKYATPNKAAAGSIDPELANDPTVYPSEQVLERCQWLQDRGAEIAKIERLWQEVRN